MSEQTRMSKYKDLRNNIADNTFWNEIVIIERTYAENNEKGDCNEQ